MNKFIISLLTVVFISMSMSAKTLVVYYSYTNNVEKIVSQLKSHIECDIIEIEPAVKSLDYAADNYAIGSAQIAAIKDNPNDASSYPAIDPVEVNLDEYDTIFIGAPLWWSQMAAPLQSYLFQNGSKLADKNIVLIVSSASSGISGVESDAKRLIPKGKFLEPNLWVRSSQISNCNSMIEQWLRDIDYSNLVSGISEVEADPIQHSNVEIYNLNGQLVGNQTSVLTRGIYIIRTNDKSQKIKL